MKQSKYVRANTEIATLKTHQIITRLDESLPLETEEWQPVEKLLSQLCEFAPLTKVSELATAIASFADDQARRAYILGQEDMVAELRNRVA